MSSALMPNAALTTKISRWEGLYDIIQCSIGIGYVTLSLQISPDKLSDLNGARDYDIYMCTW